MSDGLPWPKHEIVALTTELGGERGLHGYMQRHALEGDASVLKSLIAPAP